MTCHAYNDAIDAHAEGVRDPAFEAHLSGCASCQALVTDFERLRRGAAALDEHLPAPRVWTRIAAAIDEERRRPWWKRALVFPHVPGAPVAAAAVLALLVGGAAWLDWRDERPAPAADSAAEVEAEPEMAIAEQRYEEAIAGLQQIAEDQDNGLDTMTRATLQQSLAAIDRAIMESRAALSAQPANALAHESLLDALDTKVTLLQDTVALAGEIADESDAGPGARQDVHQ